MKTNVRERDWFLKQSPPESGSSRRTTLGPPRSVALVVMAGLEIIVGAIFVFGGVALLYFTTGYNFGKITFDIGLGGIHTSLGIAAFPVVYGLLRRRSWGPTSALVLNSIVIVFGVTAEIILYAESSLGVDQFNESVVGTLAGVAVALVIILYLARGTVKPLFT